MKSPVGGLKRGAEGQGASSSLLHPDAKRPRIKTGIKLSKSAISNLEPAPLFTYHPLTLAQLSSYKQLGTPNSDSPPPNCLLAKLVQESRHQAVAQIASDLAAILDIDANRLGPLISSLPLSKINYAPANSPVALEFWEISDDSLLLGDHGETDILDQVKKRREYRKDVQADILAILLLSQESDSSNVENNDLNSYNGIAGGASATGNATGKNNSAGGSKLKGSVVPPSSSVSVRVKGKKSAAQKKTGVGKQQQQRNGNISEFIAKMADAARKKTLETGVIYERHLTSTEAACEPDQGKFHISLTTTEAACEPDQGTGTSAAVDLTKEEEDSRSKPDEGNTLDQMAVDEPIVIVDDNQIEPAEIDSDVKQGRKRESKALVESAELRQSQPTPSSLFVHPSQATTPMRLPSMASHTPINSPKAPSTSQLAVAASSPSCLALVEPFSAAPSSLALQSEATAPPSSMAETAPSVISYDDDQSIISSQPGNHDPVPPTPTAANLEKAKTTTTTAKQAKRDLIKQEKAEAREAQRREREAARAERERVKALERADRDRAKLAKIAAKAERDKARADEKAQRDAARAAVKADKDMKIAAKLEAQRRAESSQKKISKFFTPIARAKGVEVDAAVMSSALMNSSPGKQRGASANTGCSGAASMNTEAGRGSSVSIHEDPDLYKAYRELFPPFHIGQNVKLAPVNRFIIQPDTRDPETVQVSVKECLAGLTRGAGQYHADIRPPPRRDLIPTTSPARPRAHDVVNLLDDDGDDEPAAARRGLCMHRRKLLHFHEDVRPAFCATFARSSERIRPRAPLARDPDPELVDYEYDSEAEWEEGDEAGGEDCLVSSDEGSGDEAPAPADGDDGWCVPHGYLSSDEMDDDDDAVDAAEAAVVVRGKPPKVVVYGVLYDGDGGEGRAVLDAMRCVFMHPGDAVRDPFAAAPAAEAAVEAGPPASEDAGKQRVVAFPVDLLPGLLDIVSTSAQLPLPRIVDRVKEAYSALSKALIERQIRASCVRERRGNGRAGWYIRTDGPVQAVSCVYGGAKASAAASTSGLKSDKVESGVMSDKVVPVGEVPVGVLSDKAMPVGVMSDKAVPVGDIPIGDKSVPVGLESDKSVPVGLESDKAVPVGLERDKESPRGPSKEPMDVIMSDHEDVKERDDGKTAAEAPASGHGAMEQGASEGLIAESIVAGTGCESKDVAVPAVEAMEIERDAGRADGAGDVAVEKAESG
ncbi:MAG: hypothetical protein SGCHY_001421 [Lobulomycetales sp.]